MNSNSSSENSPTEESENLKRSKLIVESHRKKNQSVSSPTRMVLKESQIQNILPQQHCVEGISGSSSHPVNAALSSENTSSDLTCKDEDTEWKERCEVVTNLDHQEHVIIARELLSDIVSKLPVDSPTEYSLSHNDNRSFSSLSECSYDSAKEFLQLSSSRDTKEGDTTDFESAEEDITPNHSINLCSTDAVVKLQDCANLTIQPVLLDSDCTLIDSTLVGTPGPSVSLPDCTNQSRVTSDGSFLQILSEEQLNAEDDLEQCHTSDQKEDVHVIKTDPSRKEEISFSNHKADVVASNLTLDIDDCIACLSGLSLNETSTIVGESCDTRVQTSETIDHYQPSEFQSVQETPSLICQPSEVHPVLETPNTLLDPPSDLSPKSDVVADHLLINEEVACVEDARLCAGDNTHIEQIWDETRFPDLLGTSTPNKQEQGENIILRQSSPALDADSNINEATGSFESTNCIQNLNITVDLQPEAAQTVGEQELKQEEFEAPKAEELSSTYPENIPVDSSVQHVCDLEKPDVLTEVTSGSTDLSRLAESWSIISSEDAETSVNLTDTNVAIISDIVTREVHQFDPTEPEAAILEKDTLSTEVVSHESVFDKDCSSNSETVGIDETSQLPVKADEINSVVFAKFDIQSTCDTNVNGDLQLGVEVGAVQSQCDVVPAEENEPSLLNLNKTFDTCEDGSTLRPDITSTDLVPVDNSSKVGDFFEKTPDILTNECCVDSAPKESVLDSLAVNSQVFTEGRELCPPQAETQIEGVDIFPTATPGTLDICNLLPVDVEQALQAEAFQVIELLNLSQSNPDLFGNSVLMPTSGVQSSNQMADNANDECANPGPEPEFDANINPFQTRSKLGQSPDKNQSLDNISKDGEYCVDNGKNLRYDPGQNSSTPKVTKGKLPISKSSPKRKPAGQILLDEKCSPSAQDTMNDNKRRDESLVKNGEISTDDKQDKSQVQDVVNGIVCDSSATCPDVFKVPSVPSREDCKVAPVSATDTPVPSLLESSMSEDSGIDDLHPNKSKADNSPLNKLTPDEGCDSQTAENRAAINYSEAGPDVAECKQEEFKSATDFFMDPKSLDILENYHGGKINESTLARMSLYVKFDPLVPGHSQVSRWLAKCPVPDKPDSDCEDRKESVQDSSSPKGPSLNASGTDGQGLIDLWNSPLKVKSEAASTAPDIVGEHMPQNDSSKLIPDDEARRMLTIQELLFQDRLLMKDREWDEKLKQIEKENKQLQSQVQSLREARQEMRQVVLEYEKTMSQVIADTDKDKQTLSSTLAQVTKERDQALEDLQHVESAFADLYRRYEKTKTAVEGFKKNEEILTNCVAEYQATIKKQADMYEVLKNRAEEKLESASVEIENVRKASESEIAALRAQLKKAEMKIETLDKSLEQKAKENLELTNICDELIAQVGHSS